VRYLVISDIHGNFEALQAALEAAPFDRVLCLGDLVGYGASPNEVVDKIRELAPAAQVRGNHDKVVAGLNDGYNFVSHALTAANWSREQLTEENLHYIKSLSEGPVEVDSLITLSHGSPADEEQYILGEVDARSGFRSFKTTVCFFGHSHISVVIGVQQGGPLFVRFPKSDEMLCIDPAAYDQYLINPGSVGQPRDGDCKGSAALIDTGSMVIRFLRFEYDIATAQEKIRKAGLPELLAARLEQGR
jgi:predicted phosphodiesterase